MRVLYKKKTIIDDINKAIAKAKELNETIETIYLNKKELEEFVSITNTYLIADNNKNKFCHYNNICIKYNPKLKPSTEE